MPSARILRSVPVPAIADRILTTMDRLRRLTAAVLLLLAACAPTEPPARGPGLVVGDARARFAGEFVVRGDPSILDPGLVTVSIVRPGEDAPVLSRSWDLGDPAWRTSRGEKRLYFSLDARDAWPGVPADLGSAMELVARWDPDGNPATDEPDVARVRIPAGAGEVDLTVELLIRAQIVVQPASEVTDGG